MLSAKWNFLIALIFITAFNFSCKPKNIVNKKEGFYIDAKFDSIQIEDGLKYILVTTKLVNHTPNTIRYINYSCSWTAAYLIDNKDLGDFGNNCNKNVPHEYSISSDSSEKERVIKVLLNSQKNTSGIKFRIGFIYIPFRSSKTFFEDAEKLYIVDSITHENKNMPTKYIRKNDKANIIWSDTLIIP